MGLHFVGVDDLGEEGEMGYYELDEERAWAFLEGISHGREDLRGHRGRDGR